MANIKSQIKRIRTNERNHLRNKAAKSAIKTSIRKVRKAISENNKDLALENLRLAGKKLDKAVSKGIIHRNQAANKKSALAHAVNKIS